MSSQKKLKLHIPPPPADIISDLIYMHLEDIAGDILSHLSNIDIANAILANPRWSAVATSRARLNRLLSRNKSAPLKTFYRREELLARQTQGPIKVGSLFLQACAKCSSLNESHADPTGNLGDFRLTFPFDSAFSLITSVIHFTDNFIVSALADIGTPIIAPLAEKLILVQLFDRWTLKLVNLTTFRATSFHLSFIEDSISGALVTHISIRRSTFVWHSKTGKLTILPRPKAIVWYSFCIAKLIVLAWFERGELFATVYKASGREADCFVCIADREPLHTQGSVWNVPGPEDLNCCLIRVPIGDSDTNADLQVRSKEDFTLLRVVRGLERTFTRAFLLSECFAFVHNSKEACIDVVRLVTGDLRTVYRFRVPKEMLRNYDSYDMVSTAGRCLVLHWDYGGKWGAAVWKLPRDFLSVCHEHLESGTVGIASKCDELVFERYFSNPGTWHEFQRRIDRFGIFKCVFDFEKPAAVHVTMVNSIISDGDDG